MGDDLEKLESGAGEGKPPKTKAEDNPWYLLATLYGVPELSDFDIQSRNRIAWNRYFSALLAEETRARLVEEKRYRAEELTPFCREELHEIEETFAQRCKRSATALALPLTEALPDFRSVEFDRYVLFENYHFIAAQFQDAVFVKLAVFTKATFRIFGNFLGARFCDVAVFAQATFDDHAEFAGVTFSHRANFSGATFHYSWTRGVS
jgi:uncharacterized protein YjbI with pentapeptide repeats